MATNFFFNNFQNSQEQILIENLIIESIKIYGHDVVYVPRKRVALDNMLNEDPLREYIHAVPIEMYIKDVNGFAGEGDFLSKFNLQIRDQITFSVARRVFSDEVGTIESLDRPQEGDLIFFPLNRKLFEVKFVEHEPVFYQLGSLQFYDLKCELFEYNNEYFETGIDDIDRMMKNYSLNMDVFALLTENGLPLTDEEGYVLLQENYDINENDPIADNDIIETEADAFVDFTERDPFSEGTY
jgi:hypothetical protein